MRKNIIVAMASLAFLPAVSFAAAPTLSEVLDASGISASGHASASYTYVHLEGSGSANTFAFDQAELQISKLPSQGFGGLVDAYVGQDVSGGSYNFPAGFNAFNDSGNQFNLHQAYVQYATGGLKVIGGKFATLAGYEVAADGSNLNATRSILFHLQPFTHTGLRASYTFNDMVTVTAGVNNSSAGTTLDSDNQKTTELAIALAPMKGVTINVTDYLGTEANARTNLLDFVAAYTAGNLSLGLNGDYFTAKTGGVKNTTSGVAVYAGYVGIDNVNEATTLFTTNYSAGMRVVDIHDPAHPKEIAYWHPVPNPNTPAVLLASEFGASGSNWDAVPSYVRYRPETGQIWVTSYNAGFQILEFTKTAGPTAPRPTGY